MTQFVPCCKQAVTVTKTNQLMLYRPKTVCVEAHMQHKRTVGRTRSFLMLNLDVHKVTARL